jgi:hypothetical protein
MKINKVVLLVLLVLVLGYPAAGQSRVIEIFPSNADADCNEEFENIANTLLAGDTLLLHGGVYSQNCRRAISGRNGTVSAPIVIAAATGEVPILTRPSDPHYSYDQNNIEIENSSYLVIRGLKFRGGDSGVRFMGTNHHITFEDNEIYETGNNALPMNSGNSDSMIVRRNHIHHTGLYDLGSTEGEGMYLGCHTNTCRVSNSLIEGNYIHHLRGTSSGGNDGIEVKMGSYGNVIRDNVIHDTNIGTQYPCIFVYGGGAGVNTVEGNAVWNCGEGIYAVSDAVVRNNIVIASGSGISSYPHAVVAAMKDLTIVNNTIYGSGECFYLRWSGVTNVVLANNAAYCPGTTALDAAGVVNAQVTAVSNYVEGGMSGAAIDSVRFFNGGSAVAAFVNPDAANFWPSANSILRDAANPGYSPALDFNNSARSNPTDVGAYDAKGLASNPGWQIQAGFKGVAGSADTEAPKISITAPLNGASLRRSKITITAEASDNVGVTRVEFYVDNIRRCTDKAPPYRCSWSPGSGPSRTVRLDAKAYDAAGNIGSAQSVTITIR